MAYENARFLPLTKWQHTTFLVACLIFGVWGAYQLVASDRPARYDAVFGYFDWYLRMAFLIGLNIIGLIAYGLSYTLGTKLFDDEDKTL